MLGREHGQVIKARPPSHCRLATGTTTRLGPTEASGVNCRQVSPRWIASELAIQCNTAKQIQESVNFVHLGLLKFRLVWGLGANHRWENSWAVKKNSLEVSPKKRVKSIANQVGGKPDRSQQASMKPGTIELDIQANLIKLNWLIYTCLRVSLGLAVCHKNIVSKWDHCNRRAASWKATPRRTVVFPRYRQKH